MSIGVLEAKTSTVGNPIHCRAAVVWEPGKEPKMETVVVAAPRANQVRIKIAYTGICHTDVSISGLELMAPAFPAVFGHEATGVVESIGEGATNVQVGDHVILVTQGQCNECDTCKLNKSNWCPARPMEMLTSHPVGDEHPSVTTEDGKVLHMLCGLGTFCEYSVVHEDNVTKINPEAPLDVVCTLSCGFITGSGAVWNVAKVPPGSSVAVFGLGTVGLSAVQACKIAGASRIIGVDINPRKIDSGKMFGMTDFINPNEIDGPISTAIMEMNGGGVDYSFECVGVPKLMTEALECTATGYSMTVIVGAPVSFTEQFHVSPSKFLAGRNVCGSVLGGFRCRELTGLVEKYMRKELDLDPFVTHRRPFSELKEGLKDFASGNCLRCVLQVG